MVIYRIEGAIYHPDTETVRLTHHVVLGDGTVRRDIIDVPASGATRQERIAAVHDALRERAAALERARRARMAAPAPLPFGGPELDGDHEVEVP